MLCAANAQAVELAGGYRAVPTASGKPPRIDEASLEASESLLFILKYTFFIPEMARLISIFHQRNLQCVYPIQVAMYVMHIFFENRSYHHIHVHDQ